MSDRIRKQQLNGSDGPHFSIGTETPDQPAWTEVEEGRFMPRRVRGSFQGRALG